MATDEHQPASVDETARRRFEQLWSEGTPHPIEEFLPERTRQNYLVTLEELVLIDMEFSWKAWSSSRSGAVEIATETTADPPQVETYVHRFDIRGQSDVIRRLLLEEIELRRRFEARPPEIDDYRLRFPEIDLPDTVFSGAIDVQAETAIAPAGGAGGAPQHETLPREFGPYRLLERIGAGGMGVVYRARQSNLGRDVAVKVLRTDHLNALPPDSRQALIDRFRTESRSTARIDHPQIVSVHDVGEIDGLPYYAMQFVDGSSLADLVQSELPAAREAARLGRDVALAVQAAHDYGILHRDLKPHNIIVSADSNAPFVADFGLAKLLDEEASPTVTGEILGTPQYMSPEQAQDSGGVTVRSDVYSLGALLYFLLTGQPPFTGRSHLEILRQVIDSDPAPPRQSNPQLDFDLQVICLKCLQKDPQHRYSSAAALAGDLSSWLDGQPIAARPPGRWERLSRWCLRNPLLSGLAATTVFALVFGVAALWVGQQREMAERIKAEASEDSARAAVNDFFTTVSEDVLLNQPSMQPLRRELLERALKHYRKFLQVRQDDPALQAEIAATHYRIGRIIIELDSPAAALPSCENAAAIQRALHRERPDDVKIQRDLSQTLNFYGECLTRLDRFDDALAAFQEAREFRAALAERTDGEDADRVEFRRLLANTAMNIGLVHKNMRQFEPARQQVESSIEMRKDVLNAKLPPSRKLLRDQGKAYYNLANLDYEEARWVLSKQHVDEAIGYFEQYASHMPHDMNTRHQVVLCYRLKGEICSRTNDLVQADDAYSAEQAWMYSLALENPRVPDYQADFARLLVMRGQSAFAQQKLDSAESLWLDAHQRLTALVEAGAASTQATADLIQTRYNLAAVHHERMEWSQTLQWANQALPLAQQLTTELPDEPKYANQLADLQRIIDSANTHSGSPVGEPR